MTAHVAWASHPEYVDWARDNMALNADEMAAAFEERFGLAVTRYQMQSLRKNARGYQRTRRSKAGTMPIGSEKSAGCCVLVKVSDDVGSKAWRQKSHVVWEQAYGRPVADGCVLMHGDGDRMNCDLDNLVEVPRDTMSSMNRLRSSGKLTWCDADTLAAAAAVAELNQAIHNHRTPVVCEVCGATFIACRRRNNVKVCPDCLERGRKHEAVWATRREKDVGTATCAVCGAEFVKRQANQVNCQACIDAIKERKAHPRWHRRAS